MTIKSIMIFAHYAQQPPYNTALRYHNWGKILAQMGYEVTIFCASTVHNTDIDVVERLKQSVSECEGVHYAYVRTCPYEGNGIKRVQNMLEYCVRVKRIAKRYAKPELCIACGTYLYGRVHSLWRDVPCICDIEDLWPESIVELLGISRNNPVIRALYWQEKRAYEKCDAVVFSIAGGYDYIQDKGWSGSIPRDKVFHINMGVDLEAFDRNKDTVAYDLPDVYQPNLFHITYVGSVRTANGVKALCDAAKLVAERGEKQVRFHVFGSGTEVTELQRYCQEQGIDSVTFYGRIQKEQIPYVLSNADACLMTFADNNLKRYGGSQQKSFEYYASGKPIISNWNSAYNLIKEYDCGIVTQAPAELADAVLQIAHMSEEERRRLGANARKIAEDYAQSKLVRQLVEVFDYASDKRGNTLSE